MTEDELVDELYDVVVKLEERGEGNEEPTTIPFWVFRKLVLLADEALESRDKAVDLDTYYFVRAWSGSFYTFENITSA